MRSRRLAILHPVVLLPGVCLALVVVELQTDLAERLIGSYLRTTNPRRPKAGWVADVERKGLRAQRRLSDLVTSLTEANSRAAHVSNLTELVRLLDQHSQVVMSRQKFIEVYTLLPQEIATQLISPFHLLELSWGAGWSRTFIAESDDGGIFALLVDDRNRVIEEIPISGEQFLLIKRSEQGDKGSLDELDRFQGRVYSAEAFFAALNGLPEERRTQVVNDPFRLLEWRESLKRVGIGEQSVGGAVELGFEVERDGKPAVFTLWGDEAAVRDVSERLNEPGTREAPVDSTGVSRP
ncbi:MAG: hypothetical protein HY710_17120 [Candidatus Latescibacteria bacterium]|nr:hypothetical protein [Candidatus Latescibacterota bacterium]